MDISFSKIKEKITSGFLLDTIVYISVPFLLYTLYTMEFIYLPKIIKLNLFLISVFFLFTFTILDCVCWYKILRINEVDVSIKDCISSFGLPIFSRYIPGKILMVIGPAAYISKKSQKSLTELTFFSLQHQFLAMIFSLLIGFLYFTLVQSNYLIALFCISNMTILVGLISNKSLNVFFNKKLKDWFSVKFSVPVIQSHAILTLAPYFLAFWSSYSIAFYFFASSILIIELNILVGFLIPLSITLGNYAIFAPAGIGIREGTLAFLLNIYGLSHTVSITLAVASRAWSILGEFFIFLLGIYFKR